MKKYLLSLCASFALFIAPAISNADIAIGLTVSSNTLDTAGKEDIDSNGTIDATKNVSDDFTVGSIFLEKTQMGERFGVTLGVDYIPFDADIDKRSITQSSLKAKADGAATTGTNSVQGTVSDHRTFYLQPGMMVNDNFLYATIGLAYADINVKNTSISSTDLNKTVDLDGTKIGFGIKRVADNGLVIKLDYSETDYDPVSFTTSNNTKATADLDNSTVALSIGRQF